MKCNELIAAIKEGGDKREQATKEFYKQYFGYVIKFSKQFGLEKEDVLSIYNEAVAELIYRIDEDKFDGTNEGACSSFVYQVCFNLSYSLKKKNERTIKNNENEDISSIEEDQILDFNSDFFDNDDLRICFRKLKPKCQKILRLWAEGYSMKEIVEEMDTISNVNSASVTKHTCLKKLEDCIKKRRNGKE